MVTMYKNKGEYFMRILFLIGLLIMGQLTVAETVLVTGSNRGIGLEFVTQYADRGWQVIATSRSPDDDDELQNLANKYENIIIEKLDVTDQNQINFLASKLSEEPIDILINNAGLLGNRQKQLWGSIDNETFFELMAVNVLGPLKVSEAFAPHVALSDKKKIIVLSSIIGSISMQKSPTPLPLLAISKAAVNMAMQTVAMQLRKDNITVAMIFPGSVQTRMMHQAFGMSIEQASEKKDFNYGFSSLTPTQSVTKMISVIDSLDGEETGVFLNNDGSKLPW